MFKNLVLSQIVFCFVFLVALATFVFDLQMFSLKVFLQLIAVSKFAITLCARKWFFFHQIVGFLVLSLLNRKCKSLFANRTLVRFIPIMLSHMIAQKRWQEKFFWTMLTSYWNFAALCIVLFNLMYLKTPFCCGFEIAFIAGKSPSFMVYSNVSFQALWCFENFPLTKLTLILCSLFSFYMCRLKQMFVVVSYSTGVKNYFSLYSY